MKKFFSINKSSFKEVILKLFVWEERKEREKGEEYIYMHVS